MHQISLLTVVALQNYSTPKENCNLIYNYSVRSRITMSSITHSSWKDEVAKNSFVYLTQHVSNKNYSN